MVKKIIANASIHTPLPFCYSGVRIARLLLLTLVLSSCSSDKLNPIPTHGVILAFGDSLTYGYGAKQISSYPQVLTELSRRSVINAGISGEITADGLNRLPELLDEHSPNLLILLEGGNDILRNQDLNITKQNLAGMIELAQSFGTQVILIGVPEKKLFSSSALLYTELAGQYQLTFDGTILAELLKDNRYKSDAIHLNEAGYRKLAEHIHQLMIDNGAL